MLSLVLKRLRAWRRRRPLQANGNGKVAAESSRHGSGFDPIATSGRVEIKPPARSWQSSARAGSLRRVRAASRCGRRSPLQCSAGPRHENQPVDTQPGRSGTQTLMLLSSAASRTTVYCIALMIGVPPVREWPIHRALRPRLHPESSLCAIVNFGKQPSRRTFRTCLCPLDGRDDPTQVGATPEATLKRNADRYCKHAMASCEKI